RHYSLDLAMLGYWVKKFFQDPSFSSQRNSLRIGSGRHVFFSEEEAKLYEWIMKVYQNGLAVTYSSIKLKMAEILDKSVLNAWEDISENIIIQSFKKCGISNYLSESEDHVIYESNEDNDEESDKDNNESDNGNKFNNKMR
ncbi:25103_t:CDS:2, partial [Gigaspora margarita]